MKYSVILAAFLTGTTIALPAASSIAATTVKPVAASATVLLGNPNASPNPKPEPGFIKSLLQAESAVDRQTQLRDEIVKKKASLKFDFNPVANPAVTPGAGGAVFLANRVNYPAVTNLDIAGGALFFAPCGLNTPHTHPRASEFFTVATNNNFTAGFVLENGFVAEQNTTLTQWQGMVFPMGSIHWQQNMDCTPAVAIAGFNHEDPGASSIAQNFLVNTKGEIVDAAVGFPEQITPENFAQLKSRIPRPFAAGVEACYKKCGFKS